MTGTIAAAALFGAGTVLCAAPAQANPRATVSYGVFECSDGRTVEIFGMPVARFPIQVGFIDGRGVVARWSGGHDSGTATVLDGPHSGQVVPFDSQVTGPVNRSHRVAPPDLDPLATCTSSTPFSDTFVLDAQSAAAFGLDSSYIGATIMVAGSFELTVWVNPVQLSHR